MKTKTKTDWDRVIFGCPEGEHRTFTIGRGESIPHVGKTSGRRVYGPALVTVQRVGGAIQVDVDDIPGKGSK